MQPIVNGIKKSYETQVEIRRINASTPEGIKVFRDFNLRGHPSYILLNSNGDILWQGLGELLVEEIIIQLDQNLD